MSVYRVPRSEDAGPKVKSPCPLLQLPPTLTVSCDLGEEKLQGGVQEGTSLHEEGPVWEEQAAELLAAAQCADATPPSPSYSHPSICMLV